MSNSVVLFKIENNQVVFFSSQCEYLPQYKSAKVFVSTQAAIDFANATLSAAKSAMQYVTGYAKQQDENEALAKKHQQLVNLAFENKLQDHYMVKDFGSSILIPCMGAYKEVLKDDLLKMQAAGVDCDICINNNGYAVTQRQAFDMLCSGEFYQGYYEDESVYFKAARVNDFNAFCKIEKTYPAKRIADNEARDHTRKLSPAAKNLYVVKGNYFVI